MAGIRNRIEKTNAVFLTNVLELYQDLKFDLFRMETGPILERDTLSG